MTRGFDRDYWEQHWLDGRSGGAGSMRGNPPNPHLLGETGDLVPGTALDAGCGAGAEAIWLASQGWQVTAVDISREALAHAAERASGSGFSEHVRWIEADLGVWTPSTSFDLVATHYAHPAMPQLDFYDRIASWVAPGGTLLIVGHLQTHEGHADGHDEGHTDGHDGHEHVPPAEASATAAAVTSRLDDTSWEIVTAEERQRSLSGPGGRETPLHDVVVRATRRS